MVTRPNARSAPGPNARNAAGASIGDKRVHRRTGLVYVYEFNPDTDALQWLRYDTFARGEWRQYPWPTASSQDLKPLSRRWVTPTARRALVARG